MHKIVKTELDGRTLSLETGKLAREAGGAVVVRYGDTMVLATATASTTPREGIDFFPLLVDFEEKLYAAGKIPGGFFKREGRPTEKAILTARLVDRPMRPLFPEGYRNDVQIAITPLSVDHENPPDVLAMIGASAALSISPIPFEGPVGAIRVGRMDGKYVINPTLTQIGKSEFDLMVAGTKDGVMMVEAAGENVSEDVILEAIEFGHKEVKKIIKLQEELIKAVGKEKEPGEVYKPSEKLTQLITEMAKDKIEKALHITEKEKQQDQLELIEKEVTEKLQASNEEWVKEILVKKGKEAKAIIKEIQKKIVRHMILKEEKRPDGRKMDEIRPIGCEVEFLPRVHGSGLFTRGQTQVLTVVTLGSVGEEQRIDGLNEEEVTKRFMHHYNFPAYSVGEVRPMRGPGRREIGHGALVERALLPVIPKSEKFPYTVRLVSEVLASNGSTSMASTCGSTLALMDAGVPISSPVAGVAIGLVKEGDKYQILSDIQGIEDFLGDMDFKVTGTESGITAVQMDIKIKGVSMEIVKKALDQAKTGRLFVLGKIKKAIAKPRAELSPYAPRVTVLSINPSKIGLVIGPGGKTIRKIVEETGAQVDIEDDGHVFITSADAEGAKKAQKMVEELTYEAKVGDVFTGKVTRIMNFGAFVEFVPGKEGLVHISQLSDQRVNRVEDEVKVGDEILVKLTEVDDMGRYNLSRKAAMGGKGKAD